jgi:hypothetical protein
MTSSVSAAPFRWWHGGKPGLRPGEYLLPPTVSKSTDTHLTKYAEFIDASFPVRDDVVYLAKLRRHAEVFAAVLPDGDVYECRITESDFIGPDPDAPGHAVMVRRAQIVRIDRCRVLLSQRGFQGWVDRLS